MNIAVIPARGGSQRVPRKNIRMFAGQPIIAWSIQVARQSQMFSHIIVSTDDPEIADIARSYGALTPFDRPSHLADHQTGITPVISHAAEWAMNEHSEVTAICCLLATAPLIQVADLIEAGRILQEGDWQFCFAATEFPAPVQRSFQLKMNERESESAKGGERASKTGGVQMLFPQHFNTRSQDLPPVYYDAAQFYWGRTNAWREQLPIFADHSTVCLLPRWRVQDIDTEEDWKRAEDIFQRISQEKPNGRVQF